MQENKMHSNPCMAVLTALQGLTAESKIVLECYHMMNILEEN